MARPIESNGNARFIKHEHVQETTRASKSDQEQRARAIKSEKE